MRIGLAFHRTLPASAIAPTARQVEDGGLDELWVIEDCFFTSGPSLAAAALSATDRIGIGIGILPAVVRHPAITAMEFATLDALAPGRFVAGIGHGVQEWMDQLGLRPDSPLTALEETITTVRRLLDGDEVTFDGATVSLDQVRLEAPPANRVPILAGVRGPRSMALAGQIADGVILAEPVSSAYASWARTTADGGPDFEITAFASWIVLEDRMRARSIMAGLIDSELDAPHIGWQSLPFFEDLMDRRRDGGVEAIVSMPDDWWHELGPVGSSADANEHLDRLEAAGVDAVAFFPAPDIELARLDLETITAVVGSR